MKKRFLAIVNDDHKIKLTEDDALSFRKLQGDRIQGSDGNTSIRADLCEPDFSEKKYKIRINGGFYHVALKIDLDMLIDELGLAANVTTVSNELKAPMPGLIVDVLVQSGSEVKTGDGLLILEAMKMENKLTAAHDGVVKVVLVKATDTVEKGTVLIEFEK